MNIFCSSIFLNCNAFVNSVIFDGHYSFERHLAASNSIYILPISDLKNLPEVYNTCMVACIRKNTNQFKYNIFPVWR